MNPGLKINQLKRFLVKILQIVKWSCFLSPDPNAVPVPQNHSFRGIPFKHFWAHIEKNPTLHIFLIRILFKNGTTGTIKDIKIQILELKFDV